MLSHDDIFNIINTAQSSGDSYKRICTPLSYFNFIEQCQIELEQTG